jgi:hypothetical protein
MWMLLIRQGWVGQVRQYLAQVGIDEVDKIDDYLICRGPETTPELTRNCQSILKVARMDQIDQPVQAGKPDPPVSDEPPPLVPGTLVTVLWSGDCQLAGRLHLLREDTAVVHVLMLGRAVPVTVRREAVRPLDIPEVWR